MKVAFEVRPDDAIQSCQFAQIEVSAGRTLDKEAIHSIAEQIVIPARQAIIRMCGYEVMYSFIQPGSVGCEIGVHFGDNSERILNRCNPAKIYLVDPYVNKTANDPWTGPELNPDVIEDRMRYMQSRFNGEKRVDFHRTTSDEFFKGIGKGTLDWVYVDGDHNKDQARRDLDNSLRAVGRGGYIFGDDLHDFRWGKDVGAALDEFLKKNAKKVELVNRDFDPFIIKVK